MVVQKPSPCHKGVPIPCSIYVQNHEVLIAKFRVKLKKVGKTTRPSRYDLNQIPYDYTVKVTNRFKGLDLIECLKNYGQRFITLYRAVIKIILKKKCKKAKWLSEEALQIAEKRREAKGKGTKERYTHLNAEFQSIARRDMNAFLSNQRKEVEENNRMRKTRDLFKKTRDTKGTFHTKMDTTKNTIHNKEEKQYRPNKSRSD